MPATTMQQSLFDMRMVQTTDEGKRRPDAAAVRAAKRLAKPLPPSKLAVLEDSSARAKASLAATLDEVLVLKGMVAAQLKLGRDARGLRRRLDAATKRVYRLEERVRALAQRKAMNAQAGPALAVLQRAAKEW